MNEILPRRGIFCTVYNSILLAKVEWNNGIFHIVVPPEIEFQPQRTCKMTPKMEAKSHSTVVYYLGSSNHLPHIMSTNLLVIIGLYGQS